MSRRPLSTEQRLGVFVVAILTLGIAGITGFAYREMRTSAIATARQRLSDLSMQLAGLLAQPRTARLGALRRVAEQPAVAAFLERRDAETEPAASALLRQLAPPDTQSWSVELWDAEGTRVAAYGAPRPPVGADIAALLRRAVSMERRSAVTPLYTLADTLRYASLAVVTDGARVLGYVVQHQSIVTAAATRDQLNQLLGAATSIFVGNTDGSLWTDLSGTVPAPPIDIAGDTGLLVYERPGTDGQFAEARRMTGVPWTVMVETPRGAVLQRSEAFLRRGGVVAAIMIGIVGLFGWTSGRRLTQPLHGALEASEARFSAVVEASPNGMLMSSSDGTVVLVNAEVERLFGYTRQELLGQSVDRLVPAQSRPQHPAERARYMLHPEPRQMGAGRDLFGVRKDGTEIPLEIGLSPMEIDGQAYVLASLVDISERKASELELRRSNEELQRFAYVASHDLQEPLRTVASYVQLLERRYASQLDSDAREFIAFAVDGSRRMQRLVEDLLMLSRVGTRGRDFVSCDTDKVLDAALGDLHVAVGESQAVITRDPLPRVHADPDQLRQLFSNLVGNALKFRNGEPPRVEIAARREGPHWVFTVRDHGIGIEPQYFDRIFVIFQRLHGRDEYPGTGIGLAICKKIVERHGGRIWVESRMNDGARFSFTLPATQES